MKTKDASEKVARFSSNTSIGFPEDDSAASSNNQQQQELNYQYQCDMENEKLLSAVYCLALICNIHRRIALQKQASGYYFLPTTQFKDSVPFSKHFRNLLKA